MEAFIGCCVVADGGMCPFERECCCCCCGCCGGPFEAGVAGTVVGPWGVVPWFAKEVCGVVVAAALEAGIVEDPGIDVVLGWEKL